MSERPSRTVSHSRVETVHLMHPENLNAAGRLYGGTLMSWIDDVAVLVAKRHTGMDVTTACVENLRFMSSATIHDVIIIKGKATHVGNSSMEIKVETYVEHLDGSEHMVNCAYLTLVGLDKNGRPSQIPDLILETEEERRDWGHAEKRREIRMKQKANGFSFYG